jgi:hypothetical protein
MKLNFVSTERIYIDYTVIVSRDEERKPSGSTRPQVVAVGKHNSLFGWLVADGWCWFVLREKYCWLVAGGWFVLREKYCWLVADKLSEQAASCHTGQQSEGILRDLLGTPSACKCNANPQPRWHTALAELQG